MDGIFHRTTKEATLEAAYNMIFLLYQCTTFIVNTWFRFLHLMRRKRDRFVTHIAVLSTISEAHEVISILIFILISVFNRRRILSVHLLITLMPLYGIGLLGRNFEARRAHRKLISEFVRGFERQKYILKFFCRDRIIY